MKVTTGYIKKLVKEELKRVLKENQGIADPDGVLEMFGTATKAAIEDAFQKRGFDGGMLKAQKSGNDYAIFIDWGVSGVLNEPLVFLNPNTKMINIPQKPAKTEHEDINKKIDDMKLKIRGAVETDNLAMKRSLG